MKLNVEYSAIRSNPINAMRGPCLAATGLRKRESGETSRKYDEADIQTGRLGTAVSDLENPT